MNSKILFVLLVIFCVLSPSFAAKAKKPVKDSKTDDSGVNKKGVDDLLLHRTKDGENVS